jgi:hypothetical protein
MSRALGIIAFCSFCAAAPAPAPSPGRDVSAYVTLGPLLLLDSARSIFTDDDRERARSEMRRFLRDSWQQQRRARLLVVMTTLEGLPSLSTFYVEPDSTGAWHIVIDTVATLPGTRPSGEHYTEDHTVSGILQTYDADGESHVRIVNGDRTLVDL